jgi:hypothetical protein
MEVKVWEKGIIPFEVCFKIIFYMPDVFTSNCS